MANHVSKKMSLKDIPKGTLKRIISYVISRHKIRFTLIVILVVCVLTALGKFDNMVAKCKCGLIIPTTGFAHSVASSMLDYKTDGMVTGLGANFFKLAGSVILFGIVSAFFLIVFKVILYG